jgi:lipopolysaccharide export system permease protein
MAACWQWVVPQVGAALATDRAFLGEGSPVQDFLVHESHDVVSQRLYVKEFNPVTRTVKGLCLLVESDLFAENYLVEAPSAVWDESRGDWRLEGGMIRRLRLDEPKTWLERPDVTPAVLLQQSRDTIDPETLSYTDLIEISAARPNRADVRLALHRHITFPLANLLLLLLALPMAVRYEHGSSVDRVLAAIALCAGYMLFDLTCQQLGYRHLLHPVVAAWTPTIVFGSLGAVLFGSTRT